MKYKQGKISAALSPEPHERGGGGNQQKGRNLAQEAEMNPSPIPELQMGPGFKLCLANDIEKEMMGEAVPLTDNGRPFLKVIT